MQLPVFLAAAVTALFTPTASARTASEVPPASFVQDALCVHSGYLYSTHWQPGSHLDYVLFGHRYWRTPTRYGWGEAAWDAHNAGYGGGMQMDATFQQAYGPEFLQRYGPAGRWPAAVQILVAYRGWLKQGWGAWPNTSRACRLR